MSNDEDLWKLEEQFWLGDAAFYERTLTPDAFMVLPSPAGILDRAGTVQSIRSAARWKRVVFEQQRYALPAAGTAILAYCVQATRGDADCEYSARCSSTYVRADDGWRLALHHQTPLSRSDNDPA